MNLSLGIVGLPNVGKSTLFNALTNKSAPVENYPFTTIDPNVGIVPLNKTKLKQIAKAEGSKKITPATIKFVDIAGLVKGASRGEGLGNKFLANIREVDAIIHLVRNFEDKNVSIVNKTISPLRDKEIIETELMIRDIETVEKKLAEIDKKSKGDQKLIDRVNYLKKLNEHLTSGKLANNFKKPTEDEVRILRKELFLLTDKPILYLVNDSQEKIDKRKESDLRESLNLEHKQVLVILDAQLEEEISKLEPDEK